MLANTLVTNEVKNSTGAEVEFSRASTEGRTTVFKQSAETPNAPHRLKISHQESGAGTKLVRRSVVRVDKTVTGADSNPVVVTAYTVLVHPVGNLASQAEPKHVLAELMSFCASLGASTTILYDGTGNGAVCLLEGDL